MARLARNQLDILATLAQSDHKLAGGDIADVIGGLGRSSVYAALAALQRDGMVEAEWDLGGVRPRRVFRITAIGEQALAAAQRESPALRRAMRLQGAS
jgi:DNA-binding PadR family transcriptional regulator